MSHKKLRFIAFLMVCIILASVVAVPIGETKRKDKNSKAGLILAALLTLEDILSGIDRVLPLIVKDLDAMENQLAEINDELLYKLYPRRDELEAELDDVQDELDKLLTEEADAEKKKKDAKDRISDLKSEISNIKSVLKRVSPSDEEHIAWLESQLSEKETQLSDAEAEVKAADKIIGSLWRSIKISHYETVIGDAFSGLTQQLNGLNYRIKTLEEKSDKLKIAIEDKGKEKKDTKDRRKEVQAKVDKKRAEHEEQKKKDAELKRMKQNPSPDDI